MTGSVTSPEPPPTRHTVVVCFTRLSHMLQYLLTTQAVTQIWIDGFGGDFAAMARLQGLCSTVSSLVAFAVGPALGSLTDSIGRKPVLFLPPLFDLAQRALVIPLMTLSSEVVARTAFGGVVAPIMGVFDAALGDLHATTPMVLGMWQSRMGLGQAAGMVMMPFLSSFLAAKDLRLPFIVSAGVCVTNLVVTKFALVETLPKERRKPWAWKSSSPLSFLGLFRSGARLRTLSCLVLIDNLIQPVLGGHNGMMQIYQADALSWGLMQRGRFESVSSLLAFPGGIAMPFLMRKVGLAWTARIGIASTGVGLLAFYLARTSLHFYGAALLGTLGRGASMSLSPALSAMIAAEGTAVGLGQGELNGMIGNLRSVLGSFSGLLWGVVYGFGSRRGTPSLFFLVAMLTTVVQAGISSRSLIRGGDGKN